MLPHLNYGITLWGFKCERILKLQKKAARILSASKYNAHTEPLFKNLKLLKIEHILKLHELKLYYKFIHIRLPVYLQNLKLDQNSSIHNINTRGQHNIHTTRVQHEFTLPHTINNTPNIILNNIYSPEPGRSTLNVLNYKYKYFSPRKYLSTSTVLFGEMYLSTFRVLSKCT